MFSSGFCLTGLFRYRSRITDVTASEALLPLNSPHSCQMDSVSNLLVPSPTLASLSAVTTSPSRPWLLCKCQAEEAQSLNIWIHLTGQETRSPAGERSDGGGALPPAPGAGWLEAPLPIPPQPQCPTGEDCWPHSRTVPFATWVSRFLWQPHFPF